MNGRTNTVHDELRDDLAAYALGALSEQEATNIESHLTGCESCREYVVWLRPAVDLLPASVEQLEPPPSLRESLMATVHAEAHAADPLAEPPAATEPPRARRSWRDVVLRPATILAAVAVLAAGAVVGYLVAGDGADLTTVPVQAERPQDEVLANVEFEEGEDAILRVERAPALDPGHVYQAWVQRGEELKPAGASFSPSDEGDYIADLDDTLEGADAVLVSEETDPTPKVPSTEIVMSAPLEQAD